MSDFPLIEMGQEYRFKESGDPARVLCTDGSRPGFPVVVEDPDGGLFKLTVDGKLTPSYAAPFIERVPVKHTIGVNVYRDRLGRLHVVECPEDLPGKLVATLDIEFVEGQGL